MRRSANAGGWLAAGLAAVLLMAGDLRAGSISFAGTTVGSFNNPAGGTSTGSGTDSINFGSPPGALTFTGSSYTATVGEAFELGIIGYYNSDNANSILGVDLSVSLGLTAGSEKSNVMLHIPIAVNNTDGPGTPDELTVGTGAVIGEISGTDGSAYGVLLAGFGCGCGEDGKPLFEATVSASEGQVLCTSLYAQIVEKAPPPGAGTPPGTDVPSVPEPATVLLAGVGLVTVALRRRR